MDAKRYRQADHGRRIVRTPLDWNRYYLLAVPFLTLATVSGQQSPLRGAGPGSGVGVAEIPMGCTMNYTVLPAGWMLIARARYSSLAVPANVGQAFQLVRSGQKLDLHLVFREDTF